MALAAVATIRIRHVPMVAPRRGYIRVARRRKGASFYSFMLDKSPVLALSEQPWAMPLHDGIEEV
jgi:hypothetical protein